MANLSKEGQGKRASLTGFQEAEGWKRFQADCDRCRAKFAKLAKLPEWGCTPWQDLYAEAFQVCLWGLRACNLGRCPVCCAELASSGLRLLCGPMQWQHAPHAFVARPYTCPGRANG